jgi:hypothetical protein
MTAPGRDAGREWVAALPDFPAAGETGPDMGAPARA